MKDERERESEKEGRITWTSVGVGIMTWQCLEEKKKILSASAFNLYIIDYRYVMCFNIYVNEFGLHNVVY